MVTQKISELADALAQKMEESGYKNQFRALDESEATDDVFETRFAAATTIYAESVRRVSPSITADKIGKEQIATGIGQALKQVLKRESTGEQHGL